MCKRIIYQVESRAYKIVGWGKSWGLNETNNTNTNDTIHCIHILCELGF